MVGQSVGPLHFSCPKHHLSLKTIQDIDLKLEIFIHVD